VVNVGDNGDITKIGDHKKRSKGLK